MEQANDPIDPRHTVQALLRGFSIEVTPGDAKSIDAASELLPPGTETFIACLPKTTTDQIVFAATRLRRAGMIPVPHVVARSFVSGSHLDTFLGRLSDEANVQHALMVAGDRDLAAGPFESALQVIRTGYIETRGIRSVYVTCYPEGHPRIDNERLEAERLSKLHAIEQAGLACGFISQFCFEPEPILALAQRMRRGGGKIPYRVGLAGPANSASLLKYAMMCGVGSSMRALRERQDLARNVMGGSSPEQLIGDLTLANAREQEAVLDGIHFFTFGAVAKTADFVNRILNHRR
jgi:methylenetetrahydrofolate reductase (NADPH)